MNWKNWPYWLRGGLIGIFAVLAAWGIGFIATFQYRVYGYSIESVLVIILQSIGGGLIGVLVGWIYGKIKSRNENPRH